MTRANLKSREDIDIYLEDGLVCTKAKTPAGLQELRNSLRFLQALSHTPYVPKPIYLKDDLLCVSYVPNSPVKDEELFYRSATKMLLELKRQHIIHGDMTSANIVADNDTVVVLDWGEAVFDNEGKPSKREGTDSDHLWPALLGLCQDTTRRMRRWIAIRSHIKEYFGWGCLEDLGTYEGDFCGFAAVEGLTAFGVERIWTKDQLKEKWRGDLPFTYTQCDLIDHTMEYTNIRLFLSAWPYIIENYGLGIAENILSEAIEQSDVLFFETQYAGDGPGVSFLSNDADAMQYLSRFAVTEKVVSVPVAGRPANRTVWKLRESEG